MNNTQTLIPSNKHIMNAFFLFHQKHKSFTNFSMDDVALEIYNDFEEENFEFSPSSLVFITKKEISSPLVDKKKRSFVKIFNNITFEKRENFNKTLTKKSAYIVRFVSRPNNIFFTFSKIHTSKNESIILPTFTPKKIGLPVGSSHLKKTKSNVSAFVSRFFSKVAKYIAKKKKLIPLIVQIKTEVAIRKSVVSIVKKYLSGFRGKAFVSSKNKKNNTKKKVHSLFFSSLAIEVYSNTEYNGTRKLNRRRV